MSDFSRMFIKNNGNPIVYNGKTLIMADRLAIEKEFKAEIELISVNSRWRQGISFSTKGKIDVGDGLIGPNHIFWQELWTIKNLESIIVNGTSKDGIFFIYNSWYEDGCEQAWVRNAAMIKEVIGENEYVYHCNDGDWDEDFDDIVFRVKILEGAKWKTKGTV